VWGAEDEAVAGHQELFWRCLLQPVLHLVLLDLLQQLLALFAGFIVVMWKQCVGVSCPARSALTCLLPHRAAANALLRITDKAWLPISNQLCDSFCTPACDRRSGSTSAEEALLPCQEEALLPAH
jgi:hypothetical protein